MYFFCKKGIAFKIFFVPLLPERNVFCVLSSSYYISLTIYLK